ncbi:hypothetical protein D9M72_564870 [compost metagenome]
MLVKTGPSRKLNSEVRESKTNEPVMSPGIRSGVNCTRLVSRLSAAESVRTSSVLATPGTPSSRTCPRQSNAMSSPVTVESWPTTALATSCRTSSKAWRTGSVPAVPSAVASAGPPGPPCVNPLVCSLIGRLPLSLVIQVAGPSAPVRSPSWDGLPARQPRLRGCAQGAARRRRQSPVTQYPFPAGGPGRAGPAHPP